MIENFYKKTLLFNNPVLHLKYFTCVVLVLFSCTRSNSPNNTVTDNTGNENYKVTFYPPEQINLHDLIDSLQIYKEITEPVESCLVGNKKTAAVEYPEGAKLVGLGFDTKMKKRKKCAINVNQVFRSVGDGNSFTHVGQISDMSTYQSILNILFDSNRYLFKETYFDSLYLRLFRRIVPSLDSVTFNFLVLYKVNFNAVVLNEGNFIQNAKCLYEHGAITAFEKNYGNSYIKGVKPSAIFLCLFSVKSKNTIGNRYLSYKLAFDQVCRRMLNDTTIQETPEQLDILENGIRSITVSTLSSLNSSTTLYKVNDFQYKLNDFFNHYNKDQASKVHIDEFSVSPYYFLPGSQIMDSSYFPVFTE